VAQLSAGTQSEELQQDSDVGDRPVRKGSNMVMRDGFTGGLPPKCHSDACPRDGL